MEDLNKIENQIVQQTNGLSGQVGNLARKTVDDIVGEAVNQPTAEEQAYQERLDALKQYLIRTDTEVPPEEPALTVDGVGLFALCDIHAVKAKQKQGKTTMLKVCAAAWMKGGQFRVKSVLEAPRVLWLDTEQKRTDVKLILTDIQQMTGLDETYINQHLMVYALRSRNYDELQKDMTTLLKAFAPQVVILDGVVEFVASFNDESEAKSLIHDLLNISEAHHCAVVCVLHTNKADEDHNMRGHLGTMLAQKAGTVLECKKQDKIITVRCSDARHEEMPDWSICYDDNGHIADADEQRKEYLEQRKMAQQQKRQEDTERTNKERLDYALQQITKYGGSMKRSELNKKLEEQFNVKRNTVSPWISNWIQKGSLIEVNGEIHASDETVLPF